MVIKIVENVSGYISLMKEEFDFKLINELVSR